MVRARAVFVSQGSRWSRVGARVRVRAGFVGEGSRSIPWHNSIVSAIHFPLPRPRVGFSHMPSASLHSALLLFPPCMTHAPSLVLPSSAPLCHALATVRHASLHPRYTVTLPASHTCTVLHFTPPQCPPHMPRASFHPCPLCFALPLTHAPCLSLHSTTLSSAHAPCSTSPHLAVLCSPSHTCTLPHSTLLCGPAPRCFSHIPHASPHPARLFSSLLLTHATCLAPPSLPLLLSASHTCPVPRFTLPRSHPLCLSHMPRAPLHPASLCSPLCFWRMPRASPFTVPHCAPHMPPAPLHPTTLCSAHPLTHAPCLTPPCSAVLLLSASHTSHTHRLTLPASSPLSFSLTPHASLHPTSLCSALLRTLPQCLTSPSSAVLLLSPCHSSHTHRFTLPLSHPLCVSRMPRSPLHHACLCSPLCFWHMPRASPFTPPLCAPHMPRSPLHPTALCSAQLLIHAPRLASPCLALPHSAPHTSHTHPFTLPRCATLCVSHMPSASLHSAWLCSALLPTHAHSLGLLSSALFRSASNTRIKPPFALLRCPAPCFEHMPRASLHPPQLPCSMLLTNAPCSTSHCPPLLRSQFLTVVLFHFTLLACTPLCVRHVPRASFHSVSLCSSLLLTRAPCLISHCLALLLSASHTCPVPLSTLPRCAPLCLSHVPHASLHPAPLCPPSASHTCSVPHFTLPRSAPLCFTHMRRPSLLSTWLLSALHLPCLLSLSHTVPSSASHTCTVPCFTLLGSSPLGIRHTLPCSFLSATLCSALLLTHAQCLVSPSLPVLRSASYTYALPRFTLLLSPPLCISHSLTASLHPPCLLSTLLLTHASLPASPCSTVLLPASIPCLMPRSTLPGCASLCSPHIPRSSLHPARHFSTLLLPHAPSIMSPCSAPLSALLPRLTLPLCAPPCPSHMPRSSFQSAALCCSLPLTYELCLRGRE